MASVQALRLAHDEALRRLCKGSLYFFVKTFWHVVVQQGEFVPNWHIEAICDHLQALAEGRLERNRLMIFLPPRHAKSIIVNVFMPAWDWTVDRIGVLCQHPQKIISLQGMPLKQET